MGETTVSTVYASRGVQTLIVRGFLTFSTITAYTNDHTVCLLEIMVYTAREWAPVNALCNVYRLKYVQVLYKVSIDMSIIIN